MISSAKNMSTFSYGLRLLQGGLIAVMLAACSSTPLPPDRELQAAQQAIASAEQDRAADFSPQDLRQAHDKLSAARIAVQNEDMVLALHLANESRSSAELATARTAEMKARAVNDEMQQSIDALQQETRRNTGL